MRRYISGGRLAISATVGLFLLSLVGCRSGSQSMITNPLLAPSTVPPPGTRAIAPGSAQPYYQGDPVPVLQSAAPAAPVGAVVPASAAPVAQPIAQPPQQQAVRLTAVGAPYGQPPILGQGRATSVTPPVTAAGQLSAATTVPPSTPVGEQVTPAAWRRPAVTEPVARTTIPFQQQVAPTYVAQQQSVAPPPRQVMPAAMPAPSATAPRVRFPGQSPLGYQSVAPTLPAQPGAVAPPANVPQTLPVMELPPQQTGAAPWAATSSYAVATTVPPPMSPAGVRSNDGFRPRGSAR